MLDMQLIRTNPELVKENIRKKFQDQKLVLVDEVVEMDKRVRQAKSQGCLLYTSKSSRRTFRGSCLRCPSRRL